VRYLMPIDIGLIFAAGIGLGALDVPAVRAWLTSEHRHAALARLQPLLAILGGAVLALCLAPSWPRDAKTRAAVRAQVVEQVAVSRAFAKLAEASPGLPTWRDGKPADARPLVLLPARLFTQGVVDLDLPLWAVDKLRLPLVAPDQGLPEPGTVIYHVRRGEKRAKLWSSIEVTEPTIRGPLRIVPLYVDEDAGIWIVRTDAADAP
jgi:hypothetical protein